MNSMVKTLKECYFKMPKLLGGYVNYTFLYENFARVSPASECAGMGENGFEDFLTSLGLNFKIEPNYRFKESIIKAIHIDFPLPELSSYELESLKNRVVDAIQNEYQDGGLVAEVGQTLVDAGINYKELGFVSLKEMLKCVFGESVQFEDQGIDRFHPKKYVRFELGLQIKLSNQQKFNTIACKDKDIVESVTNVALGTAHASSMRLTTGRIISNDYDKYKGIRRKVSSLLVSRLETKDEGWYELGMVKKAIDASTEIDITRFGTLLTFLRCIFPEDFIVETRNGVEYVKLNAVKYAKVSAKKRLMDFAFFPSPNEDIYGFDAALQDLAENKALHEIWYYGSANQGKYPILESYLCQTFARLQDQDLEHADDSNWQKRIIIDENESNAIFNTGLVSHLFDPIYAVFNKNTFGGRQKWAFAMFVKSDDKEDQVLTRIFGDKRPLPAFYYASTSELVYDTRKKISSYNWDHIIDRCDRMPIEFLEDNVSFDYDRPHDREFWNDLASAIKDNSRVKKRFINRIEEAIEYALKRVEWNFKTSIPIYYPGQKTISFLLPLSLSTDEVDADRIDVALVLEATDSNAYIAHTILTLEQAYKSARLITRPDSDWLMACNVQANDDEDDDVSLEMED